MIVHVQQCTHDANMPLGAILHPEAVNDRERTRKKPWATPSRGKGLFRSTI
jgi:hypothetical protein